MAAPTIAAPAGEDVYCTLCLSDSYLPGAAVLAKSLRDAGTTKKLACLVVSTTLTHAVMAELQALYNYVITVDPIANPQPAKLYLMGRPDLQYTFTKLQLWKQTQFRRIVYVDADVVALRAPDELFDLPEEVSFAAAPDVGWPDAFNSGVMVLRPDMGEYEALRTMAAAGDSFDGADQGLLNQYFEHRPWKRLSFTYNCTPNGYYQYEPAYRYYKSDISMVHFIGSEKPWRRGRTAHGSPDAFQELLSRWWAVYDRHFKVATNEYIAGQREPHHTIKDAVNEGHRDPQPSYSASGYPVGSTGPAPPPEAKSTSMELPMTDPETHSESIVHGHTQPQSTVEVRRFSAPHMEWDATRGAPPAQSRPEAANLSVQNYEFNNDPEPFRPPKSYPEPPRDMWYDVPKRPVKKRKEKLPPIFPWEQHDRPAATRKFVEDEEPAEPEVPEEPSERDFGGFESEFEVRMDDQDRGGVSAVEPKTPTIKINDRDSWTTLGAIGKNAWDEISGIENYVRALTASQRQRGKVQVVHPEPVSPSAVSGQPSQQGAAGAAAQSANANANNNNATTSSTGGSDRSTATAAGGISGPVDPDDLVRQVNARRESLILTDFPTAIERPSLPVTPAPIRRNVFWGGAQGSGSQATADGGAVGDGGVEGERVEDGRAAGLAAAMGVPHQADWNPTAQLEQLRRNSLLVGPDDLQALGSRPLPDRDQPGSLSRYGANVSGSTASATGSAETITGSSAAQGTLSSSVNREAGTGATGEITSARTGTDSDLSRLGTSASNLQTASSTANNEATFIEDINNAPASSTSNIDSSAGINTASLTSSSIDRSSSGIRTASDTSGGGGRGASSLTTTARTASAPTSTIAATTHTSAPTPDSAASPSASQAEQRRIDLLSQESSNFDSTSSYSSAQGAEDQQQRQEQQQTSREYSSSGDRSAFGTTGSAGTIGPADSTTGSAETTTGSATQTTESSTDASTTAGTIVGAAAGGIAAVAGGLAAAVGGLTGGSDSTRREAEAAETSTASGTASDREVRERAIAMEQSGVRGVATWGDSAFGEADGGRTTSRGLRQEASSASDDSFYSSASTHGGQSQSQAFRDEQFNDSSARAASGSDLTGTSIRGVSQGTSMPGSWEDTTTSSDSSTTFHSFSSTPQGQIQSQESLGLEGEQSFNDSAARAAARFDGSSDVTGRLLDGATSGYSTTYSSTSAPQTTVSSQVLQGGEVNDSAARAAARIQGGTRADDAQRSSDSSAAASAAAAAAAALAASAISDSSSSADATGYNGQSTSRTTDATGSAGFSTTSTSSTTEAGGSGGGGLFGRSGGDASTYFDPTLGSAAEAAGYNTDNVLISSASGEIREGISGGRSLQEIVDTSDVATPGRTTPTATNYNNNAGSSFFSSWSGTGRGGGMDESSGFVTTGSGITSGELEARQLGGGFSMGAGGGGASEFSTSSEGFMTSGSSMSSSQQQQFESQQFGSQQFGSQQFGSQQLGNQQFEGQEFSQSQQGGLIQSSSTNTLTPADFAAFRSSISESSDSQDLEDIYEREVMARISGGEDGGGASSSAATTTTNTTTTTTSTSSSSGTGNGTQGRSSSATTSSGGASGGGGGGFFRSWGDA